MVEGIIDRSILEVFLDGGEQSATSIFFPQGRLDHMIFSTSNIHSNVTVSVAVWGLKSAWATQANSDGVVVGNVTTGTNFTIKRRVFDSFQEDKVFSAHE